jgi:hypothetical protein
MGIFGFWRGVRRCAPQLLLKRLEARIVLDAAVDPVVQDNPNDNLDQAHDAGGATDAANWGDAPDASPIPETLEQMRSEDLSVLLISKALDEIDAILDAVLDDAEVIVYDAEHDDLGTITSLLEDFVETSGQESGAACNPAPRRPWPALIGRG